MSNSYGNSWKVVFKPQILEDSQFDDFAESFFDVVSVDYLDDGSKQYAGYLSKPLEPDLLSQAAKGYGIELPDYTYEFLPTTNWLTYNVIKFPPLETDDFLIYGSHKEQEPQSHKHKLRIYAATAFGSGQHQTTRLCLKLLGYLKQQGFNPTKVLDMGCGSGILALGACRLWPQTKAMCADIDAEAVTVTLQNAADNGLSEQVHAVQSDGCANPHIAGNAPYQLILCNILARPLVEMSRPLAEMLNLHGHIILSGFVEDQIEWVKSAYEQHGFYVKEILGDENWRALLMEKIK